VLRVLSTGTGMHLPQRAHLIFIPEKRGGALSLMWQAAQLNLIMPLGLAEVETGSNKKTPQGHSTLRRGAFST
jgi:hypothetical protein